MLPVNAGFQGAIDCLQEVGAMGLDMEADEVSTQQTIQQFALPRADRKGPPISARECAKKWRRVRPALFLYQAWQQPKVVVLGQKHRLFGAVHLLQDCLGKLPVCLL